MDCLSCGKDLGDAIGLCPECKARRERERVKPAFAGRAATVPATRVPAARVPAGQIPDEDGRSDDESLEDGLADGIEEIDESESLGQSLRDRIISLPPAVMLALIVAPFGLAALLILATQLFNTTPWNYFKAAYGGVQSIAQQCRERFPAKQTLCTAYEEVCSRADADASSCQQSRDSIRMSLMMGNAEFLQAPGAQAPLDFKTLTAADLVREAKAKLSLPYKMDELTSLVDLRETDTKTVEYVYRIGLSTWQLPANLGIKLLDATLKSTCSNEVAAAGLKAGLSVVHTYLAADGVTTAAKFTIAKSDCPNLQ